MKKIMACVDFTEGTDRIIDKAIDLAINTKANLCLIHVAPPKNGTANSVCGKRSFPELARKLCKCNRDIDAIAAKIKKAGIDLTTVRARGEAGIIIADEARKNEAEMIVMGAKNNSALHHLVAGSVAAEVMKKTGTPVMLVPIPIA